MHPHHDHDHTCADHGACGCHHDAPAAAPDQYHAAFAQYDLHLHDDEVAEAARKLADDNREKYTGPEHLRALLAAIELTTLKVTDSAESVLRWVEGVNRFTDAHPDLPAMAGLCTYPRYTALVAGALEVEGMQNVAVVGGFPSSQTFLEIKTAETALAVHDGATEVDCVLPVGALLSEDYETVADELREMKAAAHGARLKVILETGALGSASAVRRAAIMALYSGADFIKTSTGKIEPGATPAAALVMCQTLRAYYEQTGTRVGFKAAGGISTVAEALTYYTIAREVLGEEWMAAGLFRIGASRLAGRLIEELAGPVDVPF